MNGAFVCDGSNCIRVKVDINRQPDEINGVSWHVPENCSVFQEPQNVSDGQLRALAASGLGSRLVARLIVKLGSLELAGNATIQQLKQVGMSQRSASKCYQSMAKVKPELLRSQMRDHELGLISIDDPGYPPLLRLIPDPPVALWGRGRFEALEPPTLAIVGSRRCSAHGARLAWRFSSQLASWGLTLVSGGARGIDACAHRAALSVGGRTVVVLGSGHGHCYPADHAELFGDIVEQEGVVVSEFAPMVEPRPGHFPRRNRIVSGLSLGVLVIEAGSRSGALITARLAAEEHGREVLALPACVDTCEAVGSLGLLAKGEAHMVTTPKDVVGQLLTSKNLLAAAREQHVRRWGPPSKEPSVSSDGVHQ